MPYLRWIEDDEATGEVAEVYRSYQSRAPAREGRMPDILKCFSLRPDLLRSIIDVSGAVHFQDGHLTRRTKEMIATFVSGLNRCPY
jgi:alkylhydroperoxidase family enzyme